MKIDRNTITGRLLLIAAASMLSIITCAAIEAVKGSPAVLAAVMDNTTPSRAVIMTDAKKTPGAQEVLRGYRFAGKVRRTDEKAFKVGRRKLAAAGYLQDYLRIDCRPELR